MILYTLRRLGIFAVSLVVASILVFVVLSALPGDPAQVLLGTEATPSSLTALRHDLGVDRPLYVQYADWAGGILRGDFGTSYVSKVPIAPQIGERLQVTGPLALLGMAFALLFSLPLGVLAAARHGRRTDTAVSVASQIGIAIPAFWAAILLVTVFAVKLGWLPAGGFVPWAEDPVGSLRSLLLPALSLALVQGAILTRYVRSAVLEVLREDFIRTARAKGHSRLGALWHHGLRNASIPIVTVLGLQFAYLLVGAVVVENVFALPGLGRMVLQAIGNRDLLAVQGIVMLLTAVVLLANFAVDLSYRLLDPRLRPAA
jgi:peptide/nickel transport system permease protein